MNNYIPSTTTELTPGGHDMEKKIKPNIYPSKKAYFIKEAIQGKLYSIVIKSNGKDFYKEVFTIIDEIDFTITDISQKKKFWMNILVEIFDNIYYHGEAGQEANFSFKKTKNSYNIEVSNFCNITSFQKLKELEHIVSQGKEEVDNQYKAGISNKKLSEKGGGGIGILSIIHKIKKHYSISDEINIFSIKEPSDLEFNGIDKPTDIIPVKIILSIPITADKKDIQDGHHTD